MTITITYETPLEAHKRRMIKRQLKREGVTDDTKDWTLEQLRLLVLSLDLVPFNACIIRSNDSRRTPCLLEEGHDGKCRFEGDKIPYDIQITTPEEGFNYLMINDIPISLEWDVRNLQELYEVMKDEIKAASHYESSKILEAAASKRTGEHNDPRLSPSFCELGDHRVDTAMDGGTYCYGFRNIRCCARCYLSHVEKYFGRDCPGAMSVRRYYGSTHPWASLPIVERPCASEGLTSYRYKGRYGWIMIGAHNDDDALWEAGRSTDNINIDNLQVWDEEQSSYRAVTERITEGSSNDRTPNLKPIAAKHLTTTTKHIDVDDL